MERENFPLVYRKWPALEFLSDCLNRAASSPANLIIENRREGWISPSSNGLQSQLPPSGLWTRSSLANFYLVYRERSAMFRLHFSS